MEEEPGSTGWVPVVELFIGINVCMSTGHPQKQSHLDNTGSGKEWDMEWGIL